MEQEILEKTTDRNVRHSVSVAQAKKVLHSNNSIQNISEKTCSVFSGLSSLFGNSSFHCHLNLWLQHFPSFKGNIQITISFRVAITDAFEKIWIESTLKAFKFH